MKYVLDASVAIAWVLPRPLTAKALQLRAEYLKGIHELIAPDIFPGEPPVHLPNLNGKK